MIKTYKAKVLDDECGIQALSLVEHPAVLSKVERFAENDNRIQYFKDDLKHNITGLIIPADRPIYRNNGTEEYYIVFEKDTIVDFSTKMMKDGTMNFFNWEHSDDTISGIECIELFIKDSERGITPAGFDDVEEGSLFGTFHISNDDVWDKIMDGSYGISMECIFSRFSETIAPSTEITEEISTEITTEDKLEEISPEDRLIDNIESVLKRLNKLINK